MREDPVISGGALKVLLVLLVAGVLGVGAFAVVGDGLPFDLPDLPDIEDATNVTTLSDTELQDTTIDGSEEVTQENTGASGDPFTSEGFGAALAAVRGAVGPGAELTRVTVNDVQSQFIVRNGKSGALAYSVRADSGDLVREDATISISGNATLDDFAFALDAIEPSAVDRMIAGARKQSGASDFRPSVLSLERAIPFGSRELRWTINAQADGRYLLFRAAPDGSGVRSEGGEGVAIPPAAQEAQKLGDCVSDAGSNTDAILECLEKFQ
jgi:hypothetical protein